ncbi:hypothetical protein CC1G_15072 [Coprinopsis cinerea okayama7|uniref:Uncharacterized protein n=1 Tax=Coprinopsis cinerea (strain Okayama-7 / 130 / ATCC MYA-4618 / FGSC 9003) TaxID=240176 RepID=D6RP86_COPC7|nr:hypothetical protein CC1G_15072 [Coprinopsis cinerea okayama7\|eukprot:XP_002910738.1 hypothetical protein CC1G_15072 [Coprinopsis cinerea okayama7\
MEGRVREGVGRASASKNPSVEARRYDGRGGETSDDPPLAHDTPHKGPYKRTNLVERVLHVATQHQYHHQPQRMDHHNQSTTQHTPPPNSQNKNRVNPKRVVGGMVQGVGRGRCQGGTATVGGGLGKFHTGVVVEVWYKQFRGTAFQRHIVPKKKTTFVQVTSPTSKFTVQPQKHQKSKHHGTYSIDETRRTEKQEQQRNTKKQPNERTATTRDERFPPVVGSDGTFGTRGVMRQVAPTIAPHVFPAQTSRDYLISGGGSYLSSASRFIMNLKAKH